MRVGRAELQELDVAIPEQVSLATLGDGVWMRVAAPPLTAVQDASPEFGTAAACFLLDRLAGTLTGPPQNPDRPAAGTLIGTAV